MIKGNKAVVLLSGGQDSTTCLYWAKAEFADVEAVSFHYGQRHAIELGAATQIAADARVSHQIVNLGALNRVAPSALTRDDIQIELAKNGLPTTFVPCRNLVFLSLAAAFALSRGSNDLVTGVCQTDYSGYPDCRRTTIDAMQLAISLGNEQDFRIHTPLMYLDKRETVLLARELGDPCWAALSRSVTCYNGQIPGCGKCPACLLRAKGFREAGYTDPATCLDQEVHSPLKSFPWTEDHD
jgi:7-cyano-7-deazaguanine synthase